MILTVTINPLLENRLFFDRIISNNNNRALRQEFKSGGKGINVSRQLNMLGLKNMAMLFLGGNNGKKLRHILTDENINISPVSTKSETRSATLTIDNNGVTTFFEPNSLVTTKEVNEFKDKMKKAMNNCSTVVFSGSAPCEEAGDIFVSGIKMANEMDKFSLLDTYGNHLAESIEQQPSAIHNNLDEINSSLNRNLTTENDVLEFLNYLDNKKIGMSFISDGANPMYASKFGYHYKITPPIIEQKDSTGSGDAFVSGVVYGIEKALVFDDFVRYAAALGALNASELNVCTVEHLNAETLKTEVAVNAIGKKMKLIDDSPTV